MCKCELSQTQKEVLKIASSPWYISHWFTKINGRGLGWSTIEALERKGMIKKLRPFDYYLTEKGRNEANNQPSE